MTDLAVDSTGGSDDLRVLLENLQRPRDSSKSSECNLVHEINLAVTKQATGHKSIASTAIYTVPTDETAGKAVLNALASTF
jgi:hypothetical protein